MNLITDESRREIVRKIANGADIEDLEEDYDKDELFPLHQEENLFNVMKSGKIELNSRGKVYLPAPNKEDLPFFTEDGKFVPMWMAQEIMKDYDFATHEKTNQLYVYNDGIYEPRGEAVVREEVQKRMQEYVKTHYVNESLEAVKRANHTPPKKFNNPEDGIVVENGLLDVKNRELKDHSPEYIHLTKIPWKYDPEAECPKIKKFVSEIVNEGDEKLIQEMFGYCLLKDYPYAKAFMLLGSGANGKSTLLNLLERFLGDDNVANPALQELLENRFAKIDLFGKLANVHADLSSKKLNGTGTFKMLTGGDTVRGEKKYQDAIKFKNHAKLLYSANELPKTDDRTEAFFRRWIMIDFPHQFTGEDADENLPEKLITEEEMSGLLNWALDGLERVKKQGGFSHTESRGEIKQKWIIQTDSLRGFLDLACETDADEWTVKEDFQKVYQKFCEENNLYTVKKGQVTKRLPSLKPAVSLYRPDLGFEGRPRCWKNLKIKESFIKEHDYVQDVQPLRTSSIAQARVTNKKGSKKTLDMLDMDSSQPNSNKNVGSKKDKIFNCVDYLENLGDKPTLVKTSMVIDRAEIEYNMDESEAEDIIEKMLSDGDRIYEPKPGQLKTL